MKIEKREVGECGEGVKEGGSERPDVKNERREETIGRGECEENMQCSF